MAYPMNRCPQVEIPEFRDYFYTLIQRAIGTPCTDDWHFVMTNSNIPPGFGPGVKADASYPLFGLTQQFSNGPKGRIFLPASVPDELGYYTRCIQYLDDAAGTLSSAARAGRPVDWRNDFTKSSGGLVWAWYWVAGNTYTPVQGATDGGDGTEPPIIVVPGEGVSEAQVQSMIDAAVLPLQDQINALSTTSQGIAFGSHIALRMSSGKVLGVVNGGPDVDGQPASFVGKDEIHAWETLVVEPGE